jgi:predicted PurR-regulated permease PerM
MNNDRGTESSVCAGAPPGDAPEVAHIEALRHQDTRSVALTGILVLLIFYTLYFTAEIAIPIVFATLLKLLLQPGVRYLARWRIPYPVGAIAMIALLFAVFGGGAYMLAGPAASWAQKAPESLPRLEQRLSLVRTPLEQLQQATRQIEKMAETPGQRTPTVAVQGPGVLSYLFSGTRSVLTGLGLTVLMLFFMLSAGDIFMRKLVEILPTFGDKKAAVELSHEVEHNISVYLVTITVMNALVGVATALAMWAIGLPDPALWGALAFVLNYVVILGPLTGVALFFLVGLLNFDTLWLALLPPAAYLAIHVIEGEWVTPMLVLARRFTLNPVLVIGSLIFWNWMWGIPGALLSVPMLAVFKIVCDRVRPLTPIGHFIGG